MVQVVAKMVQGIIYPTFFPGWSNYQHVSPTDKDKSMRKTLETQWKTNPRRREARNLFKRFQSTVISLLSKDCTQGTRYIQSIVFAAPPPALFTRPLQSDAWARTESKNQQHIESNDWPKLNITKLWIHHRHRAAWVTPLVPFWWLKRRQGVAITTQQKTVWAWGAPEVQVRPEVTHSSRPDRS